MLYRIINSGSGEELGCTARVNYIKVGQSGCFCSCGKSEAVGVAFESTAYNLFGHDEIEGADTVLVREFDEGPLVATQEKALDSMLIAMLEG